MVQCVRTSFSWNIPLALSSQIEENFGIASLSKRKNDDGPPSAFASIRKLFLVLNAVELYQIFP